MTNSRLVTIEYARTMIECENCGVTAPKHPWPSGWSSCGRSRRLIVEGRKGATAAHWCSSCGYRIRDEPNPTDKEINDIRQRLLELRETASHDGKWSARREGLVPMRQ